MSARTKDRASDYAISAKRYAEQVVTGEILACRWVQRACQRQLDDLAKFKGKAIPYLFNPKLTDKDGRSFQPADNNFKTKHLNEWVNADTAWMDMRAWDACGDPTLDTEAFTGQPCWIGLDLASKTDIAALMLVFPHPEVADAYVVFGKYYLPEDTVAAAGNSQYEGWMRTVRLTVTPGNVIDFGWIEADLLDLASRFEVQAVAFDYVHAPV